MVEARVGQRFVCRRRFRSGIDQPGSPRWYTDPAGPSTARCGSSVPQGGRRVLAVHLSSVRCHRADRNFRFRCCRRRYLDWCTQSIPIAAASHRMLAGGCGGPGCHTGHRLSLSSSGQSYCNAGRLSVQVRQLTFPRVRLPLVPSPR